MRTGRARAIVSITVALALAATIALTAPVGAFSIGSILKGAGIVILVDRFGGQIDSAVNRLTLNRDLGNDAATKVVPIISLGTGAYLGAAQVSGPGHAVDRVQAVAQLEGEFSGDRFRLKALVPVGSRSTSNIKRVYGVGVSAIIDLKL